jgi:hypothetical protein
VYQAAAAGIEFKSPLIPLLQRGNFSDHYFNPSLEKRGRGDLCRNEIEIMKRMSERLH